MDSITLRLPTEMIEELDSEANEHGVSRSEHIRTILETRNEHDELQTERDRLERRVQTLIQQRDEHRELVEYVEDERELRHRREQRREQRRQSNAFKRFAWWLFGDPETETKAE